ncbi:MAG: glutamyl-tRNA synthetase [Planctomycetes bacterium SM23_32]|nr:MAG: glutamyl-tRNA synthetase [Planctomycetes bacterium SM23_32]
MAAAPRRVRVRVAPSPTGPPHVGTAYVGLFDYVFARQTGGDFVLRIEDTDRERSTRQSESDIIAAFRWLGLAWDEGPDVGGPFGPYRQSERSHIYRQHAEALLQSGAAYRCFCTPQELAARRQARRSQGGQAGYDRLCRGLSEQEARQRLEAGAPHVVRLRVPLEGETAFDDLVRGAVSVHNAQIDDQVLLKSDGYPTYHLANVVDDHLMEITHVVRAEEWISSTPKHILLYKAFGWAPPVFIHMPLLRNKDRSKISKRRDPTSLLWYREQGYLPEALLNFLALMGWSLGEEREVFSLEEMIESFSWERVKTGGPVFDLQKLDWLNGEYIRAMSAEELLERIIAEPYTRRLDEPADGMLAITALVQERMKRLAEFDELTGFFFERKPYDPADLVPSKQDGDFVRQALAAGRGVLEGLDAWSAEALDAVVRGLAETRGWKRGALYMVLRVAVTCRRVSTPLFETMEVLGKDECMARLAAADAAAADLP